MIRCVIQRSILVCAFLLVGCEVSLAQSSSEPPEILVESFVISGTQSLTSAELAQITDTMAGSKFHDDADVLHERIRMQFQDRGFFTAEVKKLDIKVIDQLATRKPVRLEAEVSEGPRCRLSRIEISGYRAFSAEELRATFPIKIGQEFRVSRIREGLESLRRLFSSKGFLDGFSIPDTKLDSNSMVKLSIQVQEGQQYHMAKFEVLGPAEIAENLQARWKLQSGAIFNANYVDVFLQKNSSLLPQDFTRYNGGVEVFKDCRDSTVAVHLHLTNDPQHAALDREKQVECSAPKDN